MRRFWNREWMSASGNRSAWKIWSPPFTDISANKELAKNPLFHRNGEGKSGKGVFFLVFLIDFQHFRDILANGGNVKCFL